MEQGSHTSCRDTANDTGPSALFSVYENPQRIPTGTSASWRDGGRQVKQCTPAVLTSPATSRLASFPSPTTGSWQDLIGR